VETTHYALTALDGETATDPGALVRHRLDESGSFLEIYLDDGEWEDRTPRHAAVLWDPDEAGAVKLTTKEAQLLLDRWPPARVRSGFTAGEKQR
jgi:hypothetical protein